MEKFKESLSAMLGKHHPPFTWGEYTLKDPAGLEQGQFARGCIVSAKTGEESWMIRIRDVHGREYIEWDALVRDKTSVTAGLYGVDEGWDVVKVSEFFLDKSSPEEDEVELLATTCPWVVPVINTLADIIFHRA